MVGHADAIKAEFATRLRSLMDERGLTGAETARRMKEHLSGGRASRATISHYQTGRAFPRPRYLDALSLALGVDKTELVPSAAKDRNRKVTKAREVPSEVISANENHIKRRNPVETSAPICGIEDLGDEAYLRIDQRVTWDVALRILTALKAPQQAS